MFELTKKLISKHYDNMVYDINYIHSMLPFLTAWFYINIIFLNNVCYNVNGDVIRSPNVVCLKLGSTDEDLEKRFKQHLREYCANKSESLLSYHVSNGKHFEKEIKKILKEYRIFIRCAPQANKTPYEFYLVNEEVINKIKNFVSNYEGKDNMKLDTDNTECYENYDTLCDYVSDNYGDDLKIMTNIKNSLTMKQKQIFREYGYEDALKKFSQMKKQKEDALKKFNQMKKEEEDAIEKANMAKKRKDIIEDPNLSLKRRRY